MRPCVAKLIFFSMALVLARGGRCPHCCFDNDYKKNGLLNLIASQYVAIRHRFRRKGPEKVAKKVTCELPRLKRAREQAERKALAEQFVAPVSFTVGVEWFLVGRHCAK